jgi:transcriptional regulator with XRE-family HTH domain
MNADVDDLAAMKKRFAARLLKAMQIKGWNDCELAEASGVARNAISAFLSGAARPTIRDLDRLCHALGVAHFELLPEYSARKSEVMPAIFVSDAANPGVAYFRIGRYLKIETILEIMALMRNDDTPEKGPDHEQRN